MAFVTGMILIDAPASALNNLGQIPGERNENTTGVKAISTHGGLYPYVAAQAIRNWHRTTIEARVEGWRPSPIYREEKIAYTDANPIKWDDDDIFGYHRAQPKSPAAQRQREADVSRAGETETPDAVMRISPFRVSTFVSLAPVRITHDFGVMARHEGFAVIHEHQFYRGTLQGFCSLDLHTCGTFYYKQRSGYRNLDPIRIEQAKQAGLEHLETEKAYRLPLVKRLWRVQSVFEGLAHLEGGAKQTIHYTDVSPVCCIIAVTRGGNHLFSYAMGVDGKDTPRLNLDALRQELTVKREELLSPIYVGWVRGYLDEEREKLDEFARTYAAHPIQIMHPWEAYQALIADLAHPEHAFWFA